MYLQKKKIKTQANSYMEMLGKWWRKENADSTTAAAAAETATTAADAAQTAAADAQITAAAVADPQIAAAMPNAASPEIAVDDKSDSGVLGGIGNVIFFIAIAVFPHPLFLSAVFSRKMKQNGHSTGDFRLKKNSP